MGETIHDIKCNKVVVMLKPLLPSAGFNQIVNGRYGLVLFNQNDTVVGQSILYYGEYFKYEVDVFSYVVQPGWHVVDAGANIGAHTQALSGIVGQDGWVYAFEPQRLVFQNLCANMANNSIANVECENAAVGASNGRILVEELDPLKPKNFGGLALGQSRANRRARLVALDSYLDGRRLDFLKADIQGMEEDCLRGAAKTIQKYKTVLYLENDEPAKSARLLQYINKLNYSAYWHLPPFFNPNNYAKESVNIHDVGFIDSGGEYLETIGFSINILCLPNVINQPMRGLIKVESVHEHPMKRDSLRFHPHRQ
jgi:FkbM family methyltransferase